jgi:peptide alpha-N-acetyltransferase
LKAKLCRHSGDIEEAVKSIDEAQSLDTADRYLNSKCAKYLLRADRIADAEAMCGKFTREGASPADSLNEMQCMWFQTEAALSYQRLRKYGEALKKCVEIERHFTEITEDQFDFHIYCMRKMTLRAYVGLLRLEDVLKSHPFYFTAAKLAIEVYLRLHDHPIVEEENASTVDTSNMTAAELKSFRQKQKRDKKKLEKEKEKNNQIANDKNAANPDANPSDPVLEALDPDKLARPEDPLAEALRFLKPLQLLGKDRMETHLFAFEIHYRRNKIMLMLQSLKRAVSLDEKFNSTDKTENEDNDSPFPSSKGYRETPKMLLRNCPCFQRQLKQFFDKVQAKKEDLSNPVKEVLQKEMKKLQTFCLSKHLSDLSLS